MKNPRVDSNGTKRWYNEVFQLHREDDLHAVEWSDGTKTWYKNGKIHRDNGKPACIYPSGTEAWYNTAGLNIIRCDFRIDQINRFL